MYKPAGMTVHDMRIEEGRLPSELFMSRHDKLRGLQETQEAFNRELQENVEAGDSKKIKDTVVSIVEETLLEPRSGGLEGLSATVDILINDYARESGVVSNLINLSYSDFSTVMHSINVMALALRFAHFTELPREEMKTLGLSGLLHDTGKCVTKPDILKAPRRLTEAEFEEMKKHPLTGYDILKSCRFSDHRVALSALEHHEKLDGSGYPAGKKTMDSLSRIIAVIDCYEAITNDDRPYRSAMHPLEALYLMREDVRQEKIDRRIFESFSYSLAKQI